MIRKIKKAMLFWVLIGFAVHPAHSLNLTELSLEELAAIEIPALMTSASGRLIPASVTTITEEDIRMTPARNIYDLLEVYVPGALWTFHNESQHLSLRGLSSDRETKILLLVNGFKINQDAFAGAVDELINWDLNDIHEIQVIRGPGSVTYGPGAIEGVINIITQDAKNAPKVSLGTKYITPFSSKGGYVSGSSAGDSVKAYGFASGTWTLGRMVDCFDVDPNGTYGYIGKDGFQSSRPAPNWYRDYKARPQLKLHTQIDFAKEWTFWARYNQAGYTHEPAVANSKLAASDSGYWFERQVLNRYAVFVLKNYHVVNDTFSIKSEAGFHTYDRVKEEATPRVPVRDDVNNRNPVFGSNRFVARTTGKIAFTPDYELALGASYLNEFVGSGWNRNPKDMYIYGIVNGTDSNVQAARRLYYVGRGWYAQTYSLLAEANMNFDPKLNLVLSGRTDKHEYTNQLFSPRVALMSDMGKAGIYKLIAQKAQRMNDSSELLIAYKAKVKPDPEELKGVEFIWNSPQDSPADLTVSSFYNKTRLLGFNQTTLNVTNLGDVTIAGVEVEAKKKVGRFTVGGNHSYADLVKFKLGKDVNIAAISYSDALTISGGGTMSVKGTGDNLNNWANHATKLFARMKALNNRLTVHADARIFWRFEGKQDALLMFENGMPAMSASNQVTIANNLNVLRAKSVGESQYRVDASAEYAVSESMSFFVWGQNLLSLRPMRYGYDGGANRIFPTRFEYIDEPRVVSFGMNYRI